MVLQNFGEVTGVGKGMHAPVLDTGSTNEGSDRQADPGRVDLSVVSGDHLLIF